MIATDEALVEGHTLPLLVSDVLPRGFRHGFTTRAGGVSPAPYDSLNLGFRWGDRRENVLENRRRLLVATAAGALHLASQVHGARAVPVSGTDEPSATAQQQADAVVCDRPDLAVAVAVADCVPALFADPRTGACAAAHAGWRGTVAGILDATVAMLRDAFGSRPDDLRVALGPAIGPCCFQVGPEVADRFAAAFPAAEGVVIPYPGANPHVDLRLAQRLQLQKAGIAPENIDVATACTHCDPVRFFSYRRESTLTGQHMAFIRAGT